MADFTLYYSDGSTYTGSTRDDWCNAPVDEVQVVVLWEKPSRDFRPWSGVEDRQLWTGTDTYDLNGWGIKIGSLLPDQEYERISKRAFYSSKPD